MTRYALALPRCAALTVLAAAGLAYGVLFIAAVCLVIPYPYLLSGQFRLAALARRLARAWGEVDLPDVERAPPPAPERRADGWYVYDNSLFKSPTVPRFLIRGAHYGSLPDTQREWSWLFLAPFTSSLPAVLPTVLAAAGVVLLVRQPWAPAWSTVAAVALLTVAFLVAPKALPAYGRRTRTLLQEGRRSWWRESALGGWVGRTSSATWRQAGLTGLSLAAAVATILSELVILLSLGGLLLPATAVTRPLVERYRRYVHAWTGAAMPSPYRPFPSPPVRGEDGNYRVGRGLHADLPDAVRAQRYGWLSGDPATWRDHLWSWGSVLLAPISLLPALLVCAGFFGLVWQPLTWLTWGLPLGLATGEWITPFYVWYGIELADGVSSSFPDWVSVVIGLLLTFLGLALAAPLTRFRLWWDRLMLGPTAATVLASRVAQLSTTRADAVDAQAAELRRIERDLHDGAQARLIAVGLGLGAVARLMETDPARARQLLTQAQETSAAALDELRSLVRGIHPPVLAERGLGDAVRAIALDTPLPVTVQVDLPDRLEPPVESAAYFAVCEALANAARVATRVTISLRHHDGLLRMVVTDDGAGGADPAEGTGLRGIGRRLGTFDGVLTLHSPPGGPTVVTMEIPCASSSPKTSTS